MPNTPHNNLNTPRPFFFHANARICQRVPQWAVTNRNNAKMDYYTESDTTPSMIMLVEVRNIHPWLILKQKHE